MMYLFSSIKYELSNQTIETSNCPGQTTSMLGYLSHPDDFSKSAGLVCCWCKDTNTTADSDNYSASAAALAVGYIPGVNANYNEGYAIYSVRIHWVLSSFTYR